MKIDSFQSGLNFHNSSFADFFFLMRANGLVSPSVTDYKLVFFR